jgi:hypothetical protein
MMVNRSRSPIWIICSQLCSAKANWRKGGELSLPAIAEQYRGGKRQLDQRTRAPPNRWHFGRRRNGCVEMIRARPQSRH